MSKTSRLSGRLTIGRNNSVWCNTIEFKNWEELSKSQLQFFLFCSHDVKERGETEAQQPENKCQIIRGRAQIM